MFIFFFHFNLFLENKEFLEKNKTMICCKKKKRDNTEVFLNSSNYGGMENNHLTNLIIFYNKVEKRVSHLQ